jgi:CO/xanthine dehydrogenase Mo-binding subunit
MADQEVVSPQGSGGDELNVPNQPFLATDTVCYGGQPVAMVAPEERYLARDAEDLIQVDYHPAYLSYSHLKGRKMVLD